jgi:hypothetical protein
MNVRRCSLCWAWDASILSFVNDPRCLACDGTGYRVAEPPEDLNHSEPGGGSGVPGDVRKRLIREGLW